MTAVQSSDCTLQQIRNLARSDLNFVTFKNAPLILKLEYLGFESKLRGRFVHFSTHNLICWMILPFRKIIDASLAHKSLKTKWTQYFGTACSIVEYLESFLLESYFNIESEYHFFQPISSSGIVIQMWRLKQKLFKKVWDDRIYWAALKAKTS